MKGYEVVRKMTVASFQLYCANDVLQWLQIENPSTSLNRLKERSIKYPPYIETEVMENEKKKKIVFVNGYLIKHLLIHSRNPQAEGIYYFLFKEFPKVHIPVYKNHEEYTAQLEKRKMEVAPILKKFSEIREAIKDVNTMIIPISILINMEMEINTFNEIMKRTERLYKSIMSIASKKCKGLYLPKKIKQGLSDNRKSAYNMLKILNSGVIENISRGRMTWFIKKIAWSCCPFTAKLIDKRAVLCFRKFDPLYISLLSEDMQKTLEYFKMGYRYDDEKFKEGRKGMPYLLDQLKEAALVDISTIGKTPIPKNEEEFPLLDIPEFSK